MGAMKMHHASGWISAVSILATILLLALVAGGVLLIISGAKLLSRKSKMLF